jgi:hypothetical protein
MGLAAFRPCDPARAATLDDYFTYALNNDLFLPYVIINAHGAAQLRAKCGASLRLSALLAFQGERR